jgi:hypothetical protein
VTEEQYLAVYEAMAATAIGELRILSGMEYAILVRDKLLGVLDRCPCEVISFAPVSVGVTIDGDHHTYIQISFDMTSHEMQDLADMIELL